MLTFEDVGTCATSHNMRWWIRGIKLIPSINLTCIVFPAGLINFNSTVADGSTLDVKDECPVIRLLAEHPCS